MKLIKRNGTIMCQITVMFNVPANRQLMYEFGGRKVTEPSGVTVLMNY